MDQNLIKKKQQIQIKRPENRNSPSHSSVMQLVFHQGACHVLKVAAWSLSFKGLAANDELQSCTVNKWCIYGMGMLMNGMSVKRSF